MPEVGELGAQSNAGERLGGHQVHPAHLDAAGLGNHIAVDVARLDGKAQRFVDGHRGGDGLVRRDLGREAAVGDQLQLTVGVVRHRGLGAGGALIDELDSAELVQPELEQGGAVGEPANSLLRRFCVS